MLNTRAMIFTLAVSVLSSCIVVTDYEYGPDGQDGKAYFGIDYDWNPPYSYWDNNYNVPENPFFGEYYRTNQGTYEFEYFINPYEYWYGTYQIWINHGEPGQQYNQPGFDGADTYLLMICNDDGFYFEDWEDCDCYRTEADGTQIIEYKKGNKMFRVEMKKANINDRPTDKTPKYK